MNRRTFLAGVAVSVVGGLLTLPESASALIHCNPTNVRDVQQCEVGIDSRIVHVTAAAVGGQHRTQWCWAACIEMVFRYYGYHIPQEIIVHDTWGSIVDLPANPRQILRSLNTIWTDTRGYMFQVRADSIPGYPAAAASDLADNYPLIIGTTGHAMVLTALQYFTNSRGDGKVTGAAVSDPWPGNGQRALSPQEWDNQSFLARIRLYPIR